MQESNSHTLAGKFINNTAQICQRSGETVNRRHDKFVTVVVADERVEVSDDTDGVLDVCAADICICGDASDALLAACIFAVLAARM